MRVRERMFEREREKKKSKTAHKTRRIEEHIVSLYIYSLPEGDQP